MVESWAEVGMRGFFVFIFFLVPFLPVASGPGRCLDPVALLYAKGHGGPKAISDDRLKQMAVSIEMAFQEGHISEQEYRETTETLEQLLSFIPGSYDGRPVETLDPLFNAVFKILPTLEQFGGDSSEALYDELSERIIQATLPAGFTDGLVRNLRAIETKGELDDLLEGVDMNSEEVRRAKSRIFQDIEQDIREGRIDVLQELDTDKLTEQ